MKGRVRATVAAILGCSIVAYAGGMISEDMLRARQERVVPVPAVKRPRPMPYILPLQYASFVIYYCDVYDVPVWLVARLFAWESGWNPTYHSRRNENGSTDDGIAALNSYSIPVFEQRYNDSKRIDPYDPETSIRIGVMYLADLYEQSGDLRTAVGFYNAGAATRPAMWKDSTLRHVKNVFGQ